MGSVLEIKGFLRHDYVRESGHTISELEELFSITRSTVYRALARDRARATT